MTATPAQDATFIAALTAWRKLTRPTIAQNTTMDNAIDVWLLARNPPPPPPPPPPVNTWVNTSFTPLTGSFEWKFDAIPSIPNADIVMGLSNVAASAYTDLAVIIRFAPTGFIDVRSGGAYFALTNVPYVANGLYHFRVDVNLTSHTYSVYVTPDTKTEITLANNVAFRTEQALVTILNNVAVFGASGMALIYRQSFLGQIISNQIDTGWIPLAPSADSNIIYVSKAGNDSNAGTFASPVLTLNHAQTSAAVGTLGFSGGFGVRNGKPDWIVLRAGDTWTNEQIQMFPTSLSGRSATEPLVIAAYNPSTGALADGSGGARPCIKMGTSILPAVDIEGGTLANYWFFDGLELYASRRDPNSPDFVNSSGDEGFIWRVQTNGLTLQDMLIHYYTGNVDIGVPGAGGSKITNLRLNRCIFVDAYSTGAHSQGIFLDNHFSTSITQCLFDHNGWNANTTLFNAGADAQPFNQNAYIQVVETQPDNPAQTSNGTIFKGNITANASNAGVSFRTGGTLYDNLFAHNPVAVDRLGCNASTVTYNVVTEGSDMQQNASDGGVKPFGWGIICFPTVGQLDINFNIFTNMLSTNTARFAVALGGSNFPGAGNWSLTNASPTVLSNPTDDVGQTNMQGLFETSGGGIAQWTKVYAYNISLPGGPGNASPGTMKISTTPNGANPVNSSAAFSVNLATTPVNFSSNIIFGWGTGTIGTTSNIQDEGSNGNGNTFTTNDIDSAGPYIGAFPYPNSGVTVESYDSSLGGPGTLTHFLSLARGQGKANWNTAYTANAVNNYIRAGFGMASVSP